jgi:two-component system response regulator DesR
MTAPEPIRILLADDQALVRGALATLLGLEDDLVVTAQVGRGDEVLDAARSTGPTSRCWMSRCRASTGSPPRLSCARLCPGCGS